MPECFAGRLSDLADGRRHLIQVDGQEVAVFSHAGRVYAYENVCVHQGGPVGEGTVVGRVRAVLDGQRRLVREEFSESEPQLICPWHGWAYDLESGVCAGHPQSRIRRYQTTVREGAVYVVHD